MITMMTRLATSAASMSDNIFRMVSLSSSTQSFMANCNNLLAKDTA